MTRVLLGDNPDLIGLCDWEDNGYHDSDWYMAVLNRTTGEVTREEVGTTRFADAFDYSAYGQELTEADVRAGLNWLEERIYQMIREAEHSDVLAPDGMEEGTAVLLLKDHRNQVRNLEEALCLKCYGSGEWVHPRNKEDVRPCFACEGTGRKEVAGEKMLDAKGKGVYVTYPAGTAGTVVWVGTFRQIYAKGYNKRDRSTLSTRIALADGTVINVPLAKLRLDKEPMSDEELRARAHDLAYHAKFGAAFGKGYAWDSRNRVAKWLRTHPDFVW